MDRKRRAHFHRALAPARLYRVRRHRLGRAQPLHVPGGRRGAVDIPSAGGRDRGCEPAGAGRLPSRRAGGDVRHRPTQLSLRLLERRRGLGRDRVRGRALLERTRSSSPRPSGRARRHPCGGARRLSHLRSRRSCRDRLRGRDLDSPQPQPLDGRRQRGSGWSRDRGGDPCGACKSRDRRRDRWGGRSGSSGDPLRRRARLRWRRRLHLDRLVGSHSPPLTAREVRRPGGPVHCACGGPGRRTGGSSNRVGSVPR